LQISMPFEHHRLVASSIRSRGDDGSLSVHHGGSVLSSAWRSEAHVGEVGFTFTLVVARPAPREWVCYYRSACWMALHTVGFERCERPLLKANGGKYSKERECCQCLRCGSKYPTIRSRKCPISHCIWRQVKLNTSHRSTNGMRSEVECAVYMLYYAC